MFIRRFKDKFFRIITSIFCPFYNFSEYFYKRRKNRPKNSSEKPAHRQSYSSDAEIPRKKSQRFRKINIKARYAKIFVKKKRKGQKTRPKAIQKIACHKKFSFCGKSRPEKTQKIITAAKNKPNCQRFQKNFPLIPYNIRCVDHLNNLAKSPALRGRAGAYVTESISPSMRKSPLSAEKLITLRFFPHTVKAVPSSIA